MLGNNNVTKHVILIFFILILYPSLALCQYGDRYDESILNGRKIQETKEAIEEGRKIYLKRCYFCHGEKGDSNGPVADYLDPRPRDFTKGLFKFRFTATGELPTDEDLFRIISRGVLGTAMTGWGEGNFRLSDKEIWQLVYFIKTFNNDFKDSEFNPYKFKIEMGKELAWSKELVAKGKELFQSPDKGGCLRCHGENGRGDGSEAGTHMDDWDNPILPADLTKGWKYKNGTSVKEIFITLSTGLNGTPMSSFADVLSEEERWALAYYVKSLIREEKLGEIIKSSRIKGEIPMDPNHPAWEGTEALDIPLTAQLVRFPRWPYPSVDQIRVRSLYNEKDVAFLLEWNDRFKNASSKEPPSDKIDDTYVKVNERSISFTDAVAIQFPVKLGREPEKPYILLGNPRNPVNIWYWRASKMEVDEQNAYGFDKLLKHQPKESQSIRSKAIWEDGRWRLILTRSLNTNDKNDVQFRVGELIPIAFFAWDGYNVEYGFRRSLSSWYYVILVKRTPFVIYLYSFIAVLVIGGFEFWIVNWLKRRDRK